MPITKLQSEILRVIAQLRDTESFVAGGVPINRSGARVSSDLDIFHVRQERVAEAAAADASILAAAGFTVRWIRQQPAIYTAEIRLGNDTTRLEWVADSDYRFFPTVKDERFGFVLHPVDLAVNKVMAAASRREARDMIDLLTLNERVLPLGAIVWAAVGVAPGYTPEGLIAEIKRNSRYPPEEMRHVTAIPPVDPDATMRDLRALFEVAEKFVVAMPSDKAGLVFFEHGRPVQPDPAHLDQYTTHSPQRRGHWPSSPDITAAMLAYLQAPQF